MSQTPTAQEQVPEWVREVVGAACAAREAFRLMGTPHMLLEESLARVPDDLRTALRVSP